MAGELAQSIQDLSIILGTAAVTSLISQRLKQPPVLGYLIAGIILGPHVPGIVVGAEETLHLTHALSELGVILLMFTIGIEFSLRKIARIGVSAGLTALLEVGLMVSLGYLAGRLFGWNATESLFLGACLGISSTMLVAKAFEEQKLRGGFVEVTFAVLVFEDMIAILLLAVLTAVASGAGLSPGEFAVTIGKLIGFLLALLAGGLLVVPRFIRGVVRQNKGETTLIAAIAVCFGMSALAATAGYSVALGAFVGGMLVSESGEGPRVEHLIKPLRDIFAAIFFIAVGLQIDPNLVLVYWVPVLVLTALVIVGKVLGVSLGAFLSGNGLRNSVRSGLSLAQIGEFSFIIAILGQSKGATGEFLFPVAVAVSLLTSLTTPIFVRRSEALAEAFDRRLPARLQTFVTFYDGWIEQLRAVPPAVSTWTAIRRAIVMLLVDAILLLAVLAGSRLVHWPLVTMISGRFTLSATLVDTTWISFTVVVAAVLLFGVLRRAAALARILAEVVVPARKEGKLDLGSAPRRVFTAALELAFSLVVGLPLVAISQPFLPYSAGLVVLGVVVAALLFSVWQSATNLQGHVRAGSELIVEMLARQSREAGGADEHKAEESLIEAHTMLPGFPGMIAVRLPAESPAVGRTLGQLSLRVRAGATVLAITREGEGDAGGDTVMPAPREVLRAGDTLTLAGTQEATDKARDLLLKGSNIDNEYLAPR
ncbi:cation:proton antiporter [Nannocystis sp.]|uniref:cation:proton antiporter n=1 Tax=Nannocystis sp. TaxID=1962667 RepID=UPI0025DA66A1|nr:cation:proton antiporter [Nannocystis sp.]MBK7824128.1 cation:proton antiporter [Nannocystis sp.]